jgi:hypothetical protein
MMYSTYPFQNLKDSDVLEGKFSFPNDLNDNGYIKRSIEIENLISNYIFIIIRINFKSKTGKKNINK